VRDQKLPEAQAKQILKEGGCKVALVLDLNASVAESPNFMSKIKKEVPNSVGIREDRILVDEVRAGSVRMAMTIKPGGTPTPSEAANNLKRIVNEKDKRHFEPDSFLGKAKSCDVVYDADELNAMRERSKNQYQDMKKKVQVFELVSHATTIIFKIRL